MVQCKRIGQSLLLTQNFHRRFATGSTTLATMTELSDCDSIEELFGDEDELDKLLNSVGLEELDSVLENRGALVAAMPQPHPWFEKATPGDLQRYRQKQEQKH